MVRAQVIVFFGLGVLMAGSAPALAQSVSPPSTQVPPVSLPTRQEVNPTPPEAVVPKSQVHVHEQGAFAPGPCPLAKSDVTVSVRQIEFTGPGGAELSPEIVRLLHDITTGAAPQPVRVVCALRDEANFRLQQARYVAAVQIPPQKIDSGVLRLEVVTGRIVEVRVHGDAGPFEETIRARIELLKHLSPLNAAQAEKVLLQANDIPGLTIQMGLLPDTATGKPGDLIGDITVSYRRFALIGNVQNYNSHELGRETAYLRAEAYDLLGLNDRTYLAGSSTFDFKKQRTVQFGEQIGLDSHNDHLSIVSTFADSRPALPSLDLRTLSFIEDLTLDHTFVRTIAASVVATSGFEYAEQRTKVYFAGEGTPLNLDKISTLFVRLDGDQRFFRPDGSQRSDLSGSIELRKGIDVFGATHPGETEGSDYTPSRFYGSAMPFVMRFHLGADLALGRIVELSTQGQAQWADREVLNYDEFAIGNLTVGRGYDPGANTGDRALADSSEVRFNLPTGMRVRSQVFGFYDWIHLWNLDPYTTDRSQILRSVGGGVRITVINGAKLEVTYAHPLDPPLLTGTNVTRSPDRLMFSLTAQFVPFGFKL
jgi:hemolysin activation/secretion protein